jgi:fructokinase
MILCCGEALIDFVPLPDLRAYRPCVGGSVFNIAVGLGRLEAPAGFFCRVSTDFFGDMLIDYLAENSVDTRYVVRGDDPTTLAFVSLPEGEGAEPRYIFYTNDSADRLLRVDDLPDLPDTVKALHFGSLSLLLEPGASALEALMRRESRRRIISLDPNVREGMIEDRDAYRKRFEGWVEQVDILRLSRADFEYIYPDGEIEAAVERWLKSGVALCIVTLGSDGAVGYTAAGAQAEVPTPKVEVVDTVGAGDTFLAAALAYCHQEGVLYDREALKALPADRLAACLDFASRAAAINCTRAGANPPTWAEVEAFRK